MKIKLNSPNDLYIFCTWFTFILLYSTIALTFSNNYQVVFSQGYIPPPSNNIKSQSVICPQIAFNGPGYTGPDGCETPCPTTGDNIPKGCPTPSNDSKPKSFLCSQVGYSGPTYTGPDGCETPCPTTGDNIPKGCPTPSGSTSTTQNEQPNQGQQQQPDINCNTKFMIGCGTITLSNTTTTPNQSPQTNTPDTTNTGGSTGSNSFSPNQPFP